MVHLRNVEVWKLSCRTVVPGDNRQEQEQRQEKVFGGLRRHAQQQVDETRKQGYSCVVTYVRMLYIYESK